MRQHDLRWSKATLDGQRWLRSPGAVPRQGAAGGSLYSRYFWHLGNGCLCPEGRLTLPGIHTPGKESRKGISSEQELTELFWNPALLLIGMFFHHPFPVSILIVHQPAETEGNQLSTPCDAPTLSPWVTSGWSIIWCTVSYSQQKIHHCFFYDFVTIWTKWKNLFFINITVSLNPYLMIPAWNPIYKNMPGFTVFIISTAR